MDPNNVYKNHVGRSAIKRLLDATSQNVITLDESQEIANFLLEKLGNAQDNTQVFTVLEELCAKWPIFNPILISEKGEEDKIEEDNAVKEASALLKENRIEEALARTSEAIQDDKQITGGTN